MEIQFPELPLYHGWGRPLRTESTVHGLELVAGHVPPGLEGSLYRAGPDRQYPSRYGDDIFIDGEGMAHVFRFGGGQVSYLSRWVRSARFLAQEQAQRSLFGRYRNAYTNAPEAQDVHGGTANTSMMFHAGKLTVLKEDDLPYEMDPDTLATGQRTDLNGAVTAVSLSAHPKLDQRRDELITHSFQARGTGSRDVAVYIFGADGSKRHEVWFQAPWSGVVHDFGVTDEHIIIPFYPLITDVAVLKQGGPFYQWHDDKPVKVAVLPRRGTAAQLRWFEGPTASAGHMMNAVTDGSTVHLDVVQYDGNCFPFFPTPDGRACAAPPPLLTRCSFDLASGGSQYSQRVLCKQPGEMPRIDDRFQGRAYRHGYMVMGRGADGSSTVGHVDVATGSVDCWAHGAAISVHEPQFVPRSPSAPEGDGWLLVILNRLDQGHSELAIFDALQVAAGPVARLHVPVRVRSTFHGCWVPDEVRRSGRYADGARA
jgi:carotenoid cleavage dioxygenase